jgi:hypothetical protein
MYYFFLGAQSIWLHFLHNHIKPFCAEPMYVYLLPHLVHFLSYSIFTKVRS